MWSLLLMLWQLIGSFSTPIVVDGSIPFLQRWTLVHYRVWQATPFWRYCSIATVSGLTTLITLALAIPAAYGLARV